jgi:hypothetical protein
MVQDGRPRLAARGTRRAPLFFLVTVVLVALTGPKVAALPSDNKTCLTSQSDPEIPEYEHCSCLLNDEVDDFRPGIDYFENKVASGNPQFWRIEYRNTYKVSLGGPSCFRP